MILKSITLEDLKPCSQYLVYLTNRNLYRGWTDSQSPPDLFYSFKPRQFIQRKDIIKIYELNNTKESILWRVKLTWAHRGRTGETDTIVMADNAFGALQKVWLPEAPKDLRTVDIEWLIPTECILT